MNDQQDFNAYVQYHERVWGTVQYPERPSLKQIMDAPIVCFWRTLGKREPGFRVTVHTSTDALHKYAAQILLNLNTRPPEKRLAKLFVNQQLYVIKGIKLLAGPVEKV